VKMTGRINSNYLEIKLAQYSLSTIDKWTPSIHWFLANVIQYFLHKLYSIKWHREMIVIRIFWQRSLWHIWKYYPGNILQRLSITTEASVSRAAKIKSRCHYIKMSSLKVVCEWLAILICTPTECMLSAAKCCLLGGKPQQETKDVILGWIVRPIAHLRSIKSTHGALMQ
jgi:hypothetical protein